MVRKLDYVWECFENIGFEEEYKLPRIRCNFCKRSMAKNGTKAMLHLSGCNLFKESNYYDNFLQKQQEHMVQKKIDYNMNSMNEYDYTKENVNQNPKSLPLIEKYVLQYTSIGRKERMQRYFDSIYDHQNNNNANIT